VDP
jgi:ankyrin repeat protein